MPTAEGETAAAVTGLPPSMEPVREELTPMLSQYADLCAEHGDAIVLFQVGDFYEAFCEAAREVAKVCEVTLTQREDSTGEYPMAGIPIDNAASYLDALLDAGYRVAIADQVEDAEEATGLVDRAVTQVITPGTVVEDELLRAGTTNYVACVTGDAADGADPDAVGLAAVDVSTGECFVTSGDRETIAEELDRVAPAELLTGPDAPAFDAADHDAAWMESTYIEDVFTARVASERLEPYVPGPERRFATDAELRACGAALAYAEYTQGDEGPLEYVSRVRRYDPRDHLRLDAAALRSLELFENRGLGAGDTLFDVLDETSCALGRRCLERRLRRPLVDADEIEGRLDAVEALANRPLARDELDDLLADAYDLERLVGRISRGRADARDLRSLHATLAVVPDLRAALVPDGDAEPDCDHLRDLRDRLDPLEEIRELVDRAIQRDPPQEITEGGVIREGFDEDLDELRATEREGREWIADLEAAERERTGIDSLKVGHNQVHGYYLEVTDANLDRVPDDYRRRQTLKNAERYYTPELKEREDEIVGAAERADSLEYDLFTDVRGEVAAEADRIQALADAVAELDALRSLATVAVQNDYVRPEIADDPDAGIRIEGGRHPVVERTEESFVPNDADLSRGSVAVITGPNMSGKSTYMRQVALTVVLAQVGSFVPAQSARAPVVDRVFTRVGASDDIAGGQSTFMREMSELTDILHDATAESLVLLDEVGRGTSTADGRAIARAAAEFIHDELGATTLFATHYHDLTALADERERVFNLHFAATREDGVRRSEAPARQPETRRVSGDDVTFLHRVARGASSSSYGVEVAELAGVPPAVVERSRGLVEDDSDGSAAEAGSADRSADAEECDSATDPAPDATLDEFSSDPASDQRPGGPPSDQRPGGPPSDEFSNGTAPDASTETGREADELDSGEAGVDPAVEAKLRELDVATMTPLEALNTLHDLTERIDE